jgi:ATP-dependent DNA ligase
MAEAFGKLPTQSAILDGELVLIDPEARHISTG